MSLLNSMNSYIKLLNLVSSRSVSPSGLKQQQLVFQVQCPRMGYLHSVVETALTYFRARPYAMTSIILTVLRMATCAITWSEEVESCN